MYKRNIIIIKYFFPNLLLGLMLFFSQKLQAQESDTTNIDSTETSALFDFHTARVEFFTGNENDNFVALDTSLNNFHRFNPALANNLEMVYLGNLGAPAYHRFFEFNRTLGFDYGRHERDIYMLSLDELKYYRCNVPFTNLYYVAGSQGEQVFHVTHTRNVGKDFNIAIDFNKIISEGYFQNMKKDYTDVALSGWYKTKNDRYHIYFGGIRGKVEGQENGGVTNDTVFTLIDPASVLPKRFVAVSNWDNWQGQIQQQYYFGKNETFQVDDTTSATYFSPQLLLKHTIGLTDHFYEFEDAEFERTYYGTLFTDDDTLRDRTQIRGFYNKFAFGSSDFINITKDSIVKNPIRWEVFGMHQWHEVSDESGKLQYNNLIGGINFQSKNLIDSLLTIRLHGAYDFYNNTYVGKANLRLPKIVLNPELFGEYRLVDQTVIEEHYSGFDYKWDESYPLTQYIKLGARITNKAHNFELTYSWEFIDNYIQFYQVETDADIMGFAGKSTISKMYLRKQFHLGNFYLDNTLGAQLVEGAINAPLLIGNLSWYYSDHLFKSALFFQAGFDIWYNSPFEQYKYDIITGQWINGFVMYEGYNLPTEPTIDIFANFDVQTLRFFVSVENVAQGLFSDGHYVAEGYPMQPRAFHLGLNWFLFY